MTEPNKPTFSGGAELSELAAMFENAGDSSPTDDQVAALQKRAEDLEDKIAEERFMWVLVVVVLFDALVLVGAENWTAPLVIGVLQLFGLILFAQKCRVNPIMPLLDKLLGAWSSGKD